jgi:hypothetical protein
MERVLIVLKSAIDAAEVRTKFALAPELAELAVCVLLPENAESLGDALRTQRATTSTLREALGERAEAVAVFVASRREGDSIDDCAQLWGATVVRG